MTVINITRSLRVANEAGISGAEAPDVEGVITLDQVISAATEEETAMAGFKDHQMQNISLVSDQDVDAQFLGVRYAILQTVSGAPGTITFTGDVTDQIFAGDLVRLEDMPSAGDDGVYMIFSVVFAAGTTTITLENGQDIPTAGGGAVGTFARVCSTTRQTYFYLIDTAAITGILTILGDVSDKFAAGEFIEIQGSTGNDGYWVIDTVTTDGPPVTTTTITVNGGTLPDATNDGWLAKVTAFIQLTANEPYLWSIKGGASNPFTQGVTSPLLNHPVHNAFRGDVIHCMVNNVGATNANFDGRIGTNAIIF